MNNIVKIAKYIKTSGNARFSLSDEGKKKLNKINSILKNWKASKPQDALKELDPMGLDTGVIEISYMIAVRDLPWEDESDFLSVDKFRREQILKNYNAKSYDDMVAKNKQELAHKTKEIESEFHSVKSIVPKARLDSHKDHNSVIISYISIPIRSIGVVRSA